MKRTCPKCGAEALIAGLQAPRTPLYGGDAVAKVFKCHACDAQIVVGADEDKPPQVADPQVAVRPLEGS